MWRSCTYSLRWLPGEGERIAAHQCGVSPLHGRGRHSMRRLAFAHARRMEIEWSKKPGRAASIIGVNAPRCHAIATAYNEAGDDCLSYADGDTARLFIAALWAVTFPCAAFGLAVVFREMSPAKKRVASGR